ncbi:kinase-like domain-containing protein [Calycina marina]|uniref:dual-specificity kinase n=1 Tax=Calycina marina TaxID=1763456 RepID=A0A9P7Z6U6_9HELO|nr:kinase-like domain-containing protein [Calycina marina]
MSTTGTLPPPYQNYGHSHHQHCTSTGGYIAHNQASDAGNRPGQQYHLAPTSTSSASAHKAADTLPPIRNAHQSEEASVTVSASESMSKPPTKKRRADWGNYFANGIPKEIIVIDDTPEPEDSASVAPNRHSNHQDAHVNGRHAAKKRKRDEAGSAYDPVYQLDRDSNSRAPRYKESHSGSTVSTDRTTSAIHTTAATSLGSNSSNTHPNGRNNYDAQPGQKRKRTGTATRLQIANEAKRKEQADKGDAFTSYKPPPNPPVKAPEVNVRKVPDLSHNQNSKVDDDDGHYIVVPDADLTDRYSVKKLLGQGTFGKVVQATDLRRNKFVAIKIIRSVQKYRDASRIELRVLSTLKANDQENRNRCIHLRDTFDYRGHICIVMDLLGQSVFDFLKGNSFVPFPNSQIQSFARQLFTSVAFLHDLNLIHTDLKPENILLCDSAYQAFTYNRRIPSSSTTVSRHAVQRKVLLDTEIRLIDFGSATFQDEYHSSVVSTRHYRAPEIILGLGWSYPCDIWSIGCILVEFYTGDALFQTHDNLEHLAMMEAVCAGKMDPKLIQSVNAMSKRSGGNAASKWFKRLKLDYPAPETTRASKRFVKAMKKLEEIIPDNNKFCRNFLDLLRKIFIYDPNQRITAKEALQHSWFKEAAAPDDGTEAQKIRQQRLAAALVIEDSPTSARPAATYRN